MLWFMLWAGGAESSRQRIGSSWAQGLVTAWSRPGGGLEAALAVPPTLSESSREHRL
jgi:hypothetical protein